MVLVLSIVVNSILMADRNKSKICSVGIGAFSINVIREGHFSIMELI